MAAAASKIRHFPLSRCFNHIIRNRHVPSLTPPPPPVTTSPRCFPSSSPLHPNHHFFRSNRLHTFNYSTAAANAAAKSSPSWVGPVGAFLKGWRSRIAADPQFPFKVVMEQLVGVTACVAGDMATRPNYGLNELDFVFSTLVVSSILNFVLMYLLAPTKSASIQTLPWIFANSPVSHMFEKGSYTILNRFGTLLYKGVLFAAVGFAAGLVGTAISSGLIKMRKAMDPEFQTPNKAPPTILNAGTWAIQMGVSSNFRYQTLNGIEFLLANLVRPVVFKSSVVVLRCLNNVLGGASFVMLARLTGAQSVKEVGSVTEEEKSGGEKED